MARNPVASTGGERDAGGGQQRVESVSLIRRPGGAPRHSYGPAREKPTGTGTAGGTWYALNGPDIWALGSVDPALAYREYKANTRAAYAHAYPGNWFGVLSGPDSYDSFESGTPGQPSIPMYPVQDSLPPAWELFDTTAEAGISATAGGYVIDPHWPFATFTWNTPVIGVSYAPGRAQGYVRAAGDGTITMRVRVPAGTGPQLTLRADGRARAPHRARRLRAMDHERRP